MEERTEYMPMRGMSVDPYTIVRDVARWWLVILLLSVSVSLLTYIYVRSSYNPTYTVESTYVVSQKGSSYAYSELSAAQEAATKMSQILSSSVLQKKVCEDLGLFTFPGHASAEVVPETNILTITMRASSPELAFNLLESTMENYPTVSEYLLSNVVLEVLENPVIPEQPDHALNTRTPMMKSFLFTAAALIALFALLSYLKDTVRTEKDAKNKIDTTLLGTIHHEQRYKTLKAKIRRPKGSILVTNTSSSFRYVENMRKLGVKIKKKMDENGQKVVLVSSVLENEGKSTVAANLALVMAQEDAKVVLIDCDFRKPSQFKIFDKEKESLIELGEVICQRADADQLISQDELTGLYFIMGSRMYPDSTEMIGSKRFKTLLDYLKEKMDYVVIDSSPMALVADTEELTEYVDAAILVVRQHRAQISELNDAVDILDDGQNRLLGCILNDLYDSLGETMGQYG
ncbi:MAG: polysaccharide biosynthesis tyrosine autokinase, partial [Lachnospiraceae bacterium]|nr:polysaccharide biosynthesis tyrosine autokinase [Lachnospiraceae bacterium]